MCWYCLCEFLHRYAKISVTFYKDADEISIAGQVFSEGLSGCLCVYCKPSDSLMLFVQKYLKFRSRHLSFFSWFELHQLGYSFVKAKLLFVVFVLTWQVKMLV